MPFWLNQVVRRRTNAERHALLHVQRRVRRYASPASTGTARPRSTTEAGSGTAAVTVALIVDTPPFVVGGSRLMRPAVPSSAETIVKINPSRFCDSGEVNSILASLVVPEIIPLIAPEKVIESNGNAAFVTVRVKGLLTVSGEPVGAVEATVNVPRLTLVGVVAVCNPVEV